MMVPENPVVGGTVLRRAAIQSPNFVTGSSGWSINQDGSAEFNNLVVRNGQIISGVALYYTGPPGAGTLAVAIAGANGTDSFGTAYYAGTTFYTSQAGHSLVVTLMSTAKSAFFQYNAPSGGVQGTLILSISAAAGNEPVLSIAYPAGMYGVDPVFGDTIISVGANITLNQVAYTLGGLVAAHTGSGATPPSITVAAPEQGGRAGHASLTLQGNSPDSSVTGVVDAGTGAGLAGTLAIAQTDSTAFTVTAATPQQASKAWSIPANDANVDSLYRLTVAVFGKEGSTAQDLKWSVGLNGSAIATGEMSSSPANAAFRGKCVIEFHVKTVGSGGTADYELWASKGTTATPADVHNTAAGSGSAGGQAFNTTVANTLQLMLSWVSTTGAPTVTSLLSLFERVGP